MKPFFVVVKTDLVNGQRSEVYSSFDLAACMLFITIRNSFQAAFIDLFGWYYDYKIILKNY